MLSQEARAKLAAGRKRHLSFDLPGCGCVGHRVPWNKGTKGVSRGWLKGVSKSEEIKATISGALKQGFVEGRQIWNKGVPGPSGEDNHFFGKTHSPETREKMSRAKLGCVPWNKGLKGAQVGWSKGLTKETDARVAKVANTRNQRLQAGEINFGGRANPSSLTWKLCCFLERAGFESLVIEEQFGPYSVDVLLADEWLAIEVDGKYWHQANNTDYQKRDLYLLQEHDLPTIRLTEDEVNSWQ